MKRTLLLMIAVAFFGNFSFAQPFAAIQNIDPNTGQEPYEIASGDLDGDGDMDIVMATYFYNGGTAVEDYIKWYSNDGNGNFTVETPVSTTIRWVDGLTVADIDGQFGLDIVATSVNQNKLVYFLSNGTGFGSEVVVDGALSGPGEVVAGDINNDGTVDLAAVSYDTNRTAWYSNDGAGNFTSEGNIESGTTNGPFYVDMADFDGDSDLDVVVGFFNTGALEIYYNQFIESGTSTVSWIKDTVSVSTSSTYLFNVGFGDVNNDGALDVFKVDFSGGNVAWYNKTKNGPSVEAIISDGSIITNPAKAVVVDLNNDTFNDVIVTDGGVQDDAIIYFQGANNAAPSATPTLISNNNFIMYDITVEDFDNDGDMDIASIGNTSDTVFWYENELITMSTPEASVRNIKIYPNPSNDEIKFAGITEPVELSVYDNLGRLVINKTLSIDESVDVSTLQSGIYQIKFDGKSSNYKFIKK